MPPHPLRYTTAMPTTAAKLSTIVETYLADLRDIRDSGGATGELSYHTPLNNLLAAVGATLKPKVRCVGELRDMGAGRPDFGLYAAKQLQRGRPHDGQLPECGVVEVKPAGDDAWLTAEGDQVSRYWTRYRLVLVTNTRDFVLLGEDAAGNPTRLETFRLARTQDEFESRLEKPRAFARDVGPALGEYLCRALSHRARLAEPRDLAWLLASYARDGLARVEAAGDAPSLRAVRTALEEALGVRFEGDRGAAFFRSTLVQTLFYGIFSAWVLWARSRAGRQLGSFNWHAPPSGTSAPPCSGRSSSSSQTQDASSPWASSRSSTGPPPHSTASTASPSSTASARERPYPTSTSPSWRPSTPTSASSSASGTRPPRWCGTWSPASTAPSRTTSASPTAWPPTTSTSSIHAAARARISPRCCAASPSNLQDRGLGALTGAHVKRAATGRVFGFEIMPAPFVVAHLQVGLTMQALDAPLSDDGDERAGIFLTNALTGWEPTVQKPLPFPELEEERDRAERVKQDAPVLVILGNPPYNGFAGMAVDEERELSTAYRTTRRVRRPEGQGLNDLYVRFFRMAERRIAEKTGRGVVCFISNYSWLDGLSFTGMRERYLEAFDAIRIDNLHGDRIISEYAPDGRTSETVFAQSKGQSSGIKVGTAITLLSKSGGSVAAADKRVQYRDFHRGEGR